MDETPTRDWLPFVHPRSLRHLADRLGSLIEGRLWLQVVIAMVLGVGVGALLGPDAGLVSHETAKVVTDWLALPGRMFVAIVQMIVVPLVVASIVRGLAAGENLDQLKQIGVASFGFFLASTTAALGLGLGLATWLKPGRTMDTAMVNAMLGTGGVSSDVAVHESVPLHERFVDLVPTNPLASMVETDMLAVVLFSLVVGVALVTLPADQASPILDLLGSVQRVAMTIVGWAMRLVPIAVFGLLAQLTALVGLEALVGVGAYVGVVLLGIVILLLAFYLLIGLFLRKSPLRVAAALRELQLLAFSTSSSAACMPVSIATAEDGLGIRSSIAQVVVPLGVTVNMNGTALYQGVATLFLAQVFGVELDTSALTLVVVTAVGASVGTPGTPGAGVVVLASVLGSAGVPIAGIGLLLGVSRIVDMCVTVVNVTGDLAAASFLEWWLGAAETRAVAASTG